MQILFGVILTLGVIVFLATEDEMFVGVVLGATIAFTLAGLWPYV